MGHRDKYMVKLRLNAWCFLTGMNIKIVRNVLRMKHLQREVTTCS